MSKPLPPLNWFRAFEAAARRLSFTAAAQEIGLTQSAVSQQIRGLETRLGVVLFERQARGLALTDAGRKLLPQTESALALLQGAVAAHEPHAQRTDLLVSASISVSEWLLSPALGGFTAAHPEVAIRFLTAIWPDEFQTAQADVEIRFGSAKQVGHGATLLLPKDLVALKSPTRDGTLTDMPLIEAVGTTHGWAAWGEAAGIPSLEPSLFGDSYGLALQMAVDGNGAALVPEALAHHALADGRLELAHATRIPGHEGYYLWVNSQIPGAVDFGAWLTNMVSDMTKAPNT